MSRHINPNEYDIPYKLTWDDTQIGAIDKEGNIFIVGEMFVDEDAVLAQEIVARFNDYDDLLAACKEARDLICEIALPLGVRKPGTRPNKVVMKIMDIIARAEQD